jgi:hypothetical protein
VEDGAGELVWGEVFVLEFLYPGEGGTDAVVVFWAGLRHVAFSPLFDALGEDADPAGGNV